MQAVLPKTFTKILKLLAIAGIAVLYSEGAYAACSNPAGAAGQVIYNTAHSAMQFCNDTDWISMGPLDAEPTGCSTEGNVCSDGSVYAGVSPDGNVAMYTTPADAGSFTWNNGTANYIDTFITSSVTGEDNTADLEALSDAASPYQAASYCANLIAHGKSDWYLPALNELMVLWNNDDAIGGFTTGLYWSSTEYDDWEAQTITFADSTMGGELKDTSRLVRCVRKAGGGGSAAACPSNNLIGYWALEESGGTTAADSSGGYDGTLIAGPVWQPSGGQHGGALEMDGTDDEVEIIDAPGLRLNYPLTVAAWVKPDVVNQNMEYLGKKCDSDPHGFRFRQGWDELHFQMGDGVSEYDYFSNTSSMQAGVWQHVAVTYDGSDVIMYRNGSVIFTSAATTPIAVDDTEVGIGSYPTGCFIGTAYVLDGMIDEVRLYNTALDAQGISDLYNCAPGVCTGPAGIEGELIYNGDENVMQYCNGTDWVRLGPEVSGGSSSPVTVFLTSGTSWTVPADWNDADNTIELIGGGGGGSSVDPVAYGVGGGGGAYAAISNLSLTPGASITYAVGAGGAGGLNGGSNGANGGDTWFNGATCAGSSVCAKGGARGNINGTPGAGGSAASSVGTVKYSGGSGGTANIGYAGTGGGGAAGPGGNGASGGRDGGSNASTDMGGGGGGASGGTAGSNASGGNGGNGGNNAGGTGGGSGGTGGGAGANGTAGGGGGGADGGGGAKGGDGGAGTDWDATHGAGGGGGAGGGSGGTGGDGGAGGLYGGGGGGGSGWDNADGGAGAQGIIAITYTPASAGGNECPHDTWTQRASSQNWNAGLTSSANGENLAAGVAGGKIWTSTDAGANWTQSSSPNENWVALASSDDGGKLAAAAYSTYLYTSDDGGATWTARANDTTRNWNDVASSSDGVNLAAVIGNGRIWTSTDSGVNWTEQTNAPIQDWYSIASSSDGTKLVAVGHNGFIYTSTDSGVNWTQRDASRLWVDVASSADGTKLVAVVESGQIYTSADGGATWTARDSARNWFGVASSAGGSRLAAIDQGGQVYISTDSGSTWTPKAGNRTWQSLASSADGMKLVAGVWGGNIYTSACMCANPAGSAGQMIYNTDHDVLQYCNGTDWVNTTYLEGSAAPPSGSQEFTTAGTDTFTVPADVTSVTIEAWGAGGGGGGMGADNLTRGGGGGGGGSGVQRNTGSVVLLAAGGGGGGGGHTTTTGAGGGGGGAYGIGTYTVTPGEQLNIYIGGGGGSYCDSSDPGDGGLPNGTAGSQASTAGTAPAPGFGGGGGNGNSGNGGASTYGGGGGEGGGGFSGSSVYGGAGGQGGADSCGTSTNGGACAGANFHAGGYGTCYFEAGGASTSCTNGSSGTQSTSGGAGGAGASGGGSSAGSGVAGETCGSNGGNGKVKITWGS